MASGKFSCDGCGKTYTWKPELAGRRVKCKCAQVMTVPHEDPALADAGTPDLDDLYALAEGAPATAAALTPPALSRPSPSSGGRGAPALAGAGGGGAVLGYASMAPKLRSREENPRTEVFWTPGKDLYVPIALILAGSILTFVDVWFNRHVHSPAIALLSVGLLTMINLVLTIPAVLMTVKLFDLGLGPVPTGMLKIAACAIFPGAMASMLNNLGDGGFVAWGVSLGATLALFVWLLDMDFFESCICSVLIWLVRTWLSYAILFLFMGSMLGGTPGTPGLASTSGGGGGTSGKSSPGFIGKGTGFMGRNSRSADTDTYTPPPPSPKLRAQFDKAAETFLASTNFDAREWLKQNPTGMFGGFNHDGAIALLNALDGLNATDVKVITRPAQVPMADVLVLKLPRDDTSRLRFFEWYGDVEYTAHPNGIQTDEGQTYFTIYFAR